LVVVLALVWISGNKKPRRSEVFISMVTGGSRKHTVLRQRQKYTRSLQFAQFKVGFSLS